MDGHANPQKRIHPSGDVALHLAAQKGNIDIIKVVFYFFGLFPFFLPFNAYVYYLQALLKLDIPCFPRNYKKITPFEVAKQNNFDECVKLLGKTIIIKLLLFVLAVVVF